MARDTIQKYAERQADALGLKAHEREIYIRGYIDGQRQALEIVAKDFGRLRE